MFKKNLQCTPETLKLNSNFYSDQGFFEKESYFEKTEISNFEVTIFLHRLIGVFDILMTKLEFAATLPFILSHPRVLEILKIEDLKEIVSAFVPFSYFKNNPENTPLLNSLEESVLLTSELSLEVKTDVNEKDCNCSDKSSELFKSTKDYASVYRAIHILHSYPLIRQLAKESQNQIAKSTLNFLRQIKYFMEFVVSKLELLPVEERERELHIRYVCSEIERSKHEISELTKSLEDQKSRHRAEANDLSDQVTNLMEIWQSINDEFNNELTQTLKDSEDSLAKTLAEFNERMENHQNALEKLKTIVENQKVDNRKKEHEVQGKKFKVESQLSSLIMKFDTEISDRQQYYDNLMKECEALEKEKLQLMNDMDEQLNIYDNIMREKEEKEFAAYKEKYMNFVNNRCARLIQRWWRNICAKRKKKGKKKKKAKK